MRNSHGFQHWQAAKTAVQVAVPDVAASSPAASTRKTTSDSVPICSQLTCRRAEVQLTASSTGTVWTPALPFSSSLARTAKAVRRSARTVMVSTVPRANSAGNCFVQIPAADPPSIVEIQFRDFSRAVVVGHLADLRPGTAHVEHALSRQSNRPNPVPDGAASITESRNVNEASRTARTTVG